MEDLKGCPFCGGKPYLHIGLHNFHDALIRCSICDCESANFDVDDGTSTQRKRNTAEVKAAWNRRVPSPT